MLICYDEDDDVMRLFYYNEGHLCLEAYGFLGINSWESCGKVHGWKNMQHNGEP
jgi:hypothetical protein